MIAFLPAVSASLLLEKFCFCSEACLPVATKQDTLVSKRLFLVCRHLLLPQLGDGGAAADPVAHKVARQRAQRLLE